MDPSLHYNVAKSLSFATMVLGGGYCQYRGWLFTESSTNVGTCILLLLSSFALSSLASKVHAWCPGCGERRTRLFRETMADGSSAVNYRCQACGHVHETGIIESSGGE
ncbi:hypothetical protein EP7_000445 [Isosphaeraceae bacterium EP7]